MTPCHARATYNTYHVIDGTSIQENKIPSVCRPATPLTPTQQAASTTRGTPEKVTLRTGVDVCVARLRQANYLSIRGDPALSPQCTDVNKPPVPAVARNPLMTAREADKLHHTARLSWAHTASPHIYRGHIGREREAGNIGTGEQRYLIGGGEHRYRGTKLPALRTHTLPDRCRGLDCRSSRSLHALEYVAESHSARPPTHTTPLMPQHPLFRFVPPGQAKTSLQHNPPLWPFSWAHRDSRGRRGATKEHSALPQGQEVQLYEAMMSLQHNPPLWLFSWAPGTTRPRRAAKERSALPQRGRYVQLYGTTTSYNTTCPCGFSPGPGHWGETLAVG
ncbi:hypothetical protein GWK47_009480 [Chionoecetes opilio]|uniref:Uncharacterized protein n=1 Tax=Chionoecetes opilio TaxID=41210 RepID=A0A8J4XYJ9_CHIOP|nr:hypothetical protein GWK47_009480 [Chionoecetes opilio]